MNKKILISLLISSIGSAYAQDAQQPKVNYGERFSQALQVLTGKQSVQSQPDSQPKVAATVSNSDIQSQATPATNVTQAQPEPIQKVSQVQDKQSESVDKKEESKESIQPKVEQNNVDNTAKPVQTKKRVTASAKPQQQVQEKSALVSATYQHIPSHISIEESGSFLRPMVYDDVTVKTIDTSSKKLTLQLIDNRTGLPLETNALTSDKIKGLAVDSDLTNLRYTSAQLNNTETTTVELNGAGDCQAVYLTYQLKSQKAPTTKTVFLDRLSNAVENKSSTCDFANLNANETTFYTKTGYIINIGFDKKLAANNQIGMSILTSKDGRPFSSVDTVAYAISRDFKKAYPLSVQHDSRGSYFGSRVGENLPSGNYYVVVGFSYEGKYEWISTVTSIS